MKRRVVITGMGAVSPLAYNVNDLWEGLLAGKSGGGPITRFDTTDYSTKIAAEIKDYDPTDFFERKEARRLDLSQQFALIASKEAIDDSGFVENGFDPDLAGTIIGSGVCGIDSLTKQHQVLMEKGVNRVSPFLVPLIISDMAAGLVSIKYDLRGPNYSTVSACASGAHGMGDALRIIQRGEADIMVTGGTEAAIVPLAIAGFCAAKAMTTRNDEPEKASRPFDKERDGFLMGEGAAIAVFEELEHARKRGAKIYAEVAGFGMSGDAYHITAPEPDGRGAAYAMKMALDDAGLEPDKVDYINAHGTATGRGDVAETIAAKKIFGDHAHNLVINSTKSSIGHLLGAAGSIELLVTALSIRDSKIHPTINYTVPDPECDLDYSPNKVTNKEIKAAVSNSFGFGGHNASILLKRLEE